MDKVTIKWRKVDSVNLENDENAYFYSFSVDKEVVYIGISYKTDIVKEIKQNIKRFKLGFKTTTIRYGIIKQMTFNRISKSIILDSECLLIYCNKPELNDICKNEYSLESHRDNLKVLGYHARFYIWCKVEDGEISHSFLKW